MIAQLRKGVSRGWRLACLGVAGVLFAPAAIQALTLDEAVQLTITTNPSIGIAASNRRAIDEELRQARGLYLPSLDATVGYGRDRTRDRLTRRQAGNDTLTLTREEYSLNFTQRVFDGFEVDSEVARQKARIESAARRVFETSEFLALDAVGAYLEVLRQRGLVRFAEDNVQIHQEILKFLGERFEGGVGGRADVLQAEARLARTRATSTQRINDLRNAESFYNRVVGQHPDKLVDPVFPEDVLPANIDVALELAGKNNPTIRIFEADIRVTQAEVGLAESPLFPSVTLEAGTSYFDGRNGIDEFDFNQQLMLRMRWNLFRGGIDLANRREAIAREGENKNRRLDAIINAKEEMHRSWDALDAARGRVKDFDRARQFNIETRDAYRLQFNVAQRTLLDLLDAENELFVSRSQLLSEQSNLLRASYRVLAVAGVLLSTLQVSPSAEASEQLKSFVEDLAE